MYSGKKEAVSIFTLVGDNEMLKSKDFQTLKIKHKIILDNYFSQNWDEALKNIHNTKNLCNNVMTDYYKIMIERIEELGLNKYSFKDYKNCFKNSSFKINYFKKNCSNNPIAKIFNVVSKIKIFEEYFTFNIYCILEK